MTSFNSKAMLAALAGAATVAAHGYLINIVINGVSYQTFDPTKFPYIASPPTVVGWAAGNTDTGFVDGSVYTSGDIICHKNATNAGGHAPVTAGDSIFLQWNTWPESHKGPVIDYLANCGDAGCQTVDKTTLEFFKIDEVGLTDENTLPGNWGSDQLIANKNGWLVQIPENIAPGNYVLRHEIIALHSAGQTNGAQNYPQCINLQISGSGTDAPVGTLGEKLYTPQDAGISINIYQSLSNYPVPGPTLIAGASAVSQSSSAIVSSASAVIGAGKAVTSPAATSPGVTTSSATAVAVISTSSANSAPAAGGGAVVAKPTGVSGCGQKRSHARDLNKV